MGTFFNGPATDPRSLFIHLSDPAGEPAPPTLARHPPTEADEGDVLQTRGQSDLVAEAPNEEETEPGQALFRRRQSVPEMFGADHEGIGFLGAVPELGISGCAWNGEFSTIHDPSND